MKCCCKVQCSHCLVSCLLRPPLPQQARQALAALCANRATLHAMKGDHAQAEDRIRPALAADPSPAVRRAAVYVRLRRGEHGAAAELLQKGS